ncbi:AI-2E family transporter [Leptolyngbya iicbica]|uniref:AI-2E family transporter n=2 Tax=Cyanophyceae TaxID=3028117 RepID=A0A4Q7E809_9CYAN|nr:AI-2E family transporter [Leptolyngbya sp. LK]RZM78722.1 AI-2E family transporter [Leptolyngbya sp. LK]
MKFGQWITLIVLLICLYIFWQIRNITLLTFAAVIFGIVLNRMVRFLRQWTASRKTAVAVTVGIMLLILGVFGAIIVPPFSQQLRELIDLLPQAADQLQQWLQGLESIGPFSLENFQAVNSISSQLSNFDWEMVANRFFTLFSNTLSLTLNLLLVIVITIMMLLNPQPYRRLFIKVFPSSIRRQVDHVLDECEEAIAGWFIGILFNMGVIALLSTVGLWILGVPLALANGLLAGLLAFIPNMGPVLSVIPPVAIAVLDAPWKAIAVVVLYIIIQQLESNLLTPLVMKKQVSLLPAVTLLSQVIFAIFFGFLGLLLALPLTLTIQQWLNEFWVRSFADEH